MAAAFELGNKIFVFYKSLEFVDCLQLVTSRAVMNGPKRMNQLTDWLDLGL